MKQKPTPQPVAPVKTRAAKKTFKELAQEAQREKAAEEREKLLERQRQKEWLEEEEVMDLIYGPPKKEVHHAA